MLTVYRAKDFADAKRIVRDILDYQGKGHSCGIHTKDADHARELAEDIDVVRVLVNQAHTFGNGGGFNNGLPFTLSMGCGTWQGNSLSENLNWRCFVNITHLVTTIPEDKPSEEALFGAYLGEIREVTQACRCVSTNRGWCWQAWRPDDGAALRRSVPPAGRHVRL